MAQKEKRCLGYLHVSTARISTAALAEVKKSREKPRVTHTALKICQLMASATSTVDR